MIPINPPRLLRLGFLPALCFVLISAAASAATYFVKNGGNDNLSGTSDANAWANVSKVNSVAANGDHVYFKCGSTWSGQQLIVDWNGAVGVKVTVGAYYGSGVIGVSGNKPVFNGNNTVPTDTYAGLVQVTGDYVKVQNLRIINSGGIGVRVYQAVDVDVLTCDTDTTYRHGIQYYQSATGSIDGNTVREASQVWTTGTWPPALGCTQSSFLLVKNNKVYECHGEAISLNQGSNDHIVENNECYANRAMTGVYIQRGQRNTIRNNVIYGTTNSSFWRDPADQTSYSGICINDENGTTGNLSEANIIYNNLVAFCKIGIDLRTQYDGAPPVSTLKDTKVYNNTVVDCNAQINISDGPWLNSEIRNNIFWSITTSNPVTVDYTGPSDTPGLTWSHNNWTTTPSGSRVGTGNLVGPANLTKTSGWRSAGFLGAIVAANFKPTSTTLGTNLGYTGIAGNTLDYYGSNLRGTDPDMGAIEYVSAGNLLLNPGFETALGSEWCCSGLLTRQSGNAKAGSYALKAIANGTYGERMQSIAVTAGQFYTIKGWIRVDSVNGGGFAIKYGWYNSSGGLINSIVSMSQDTPTAYVQKTSNSIQAPPLAATLRVVCTIKSGTNSGTAYFDEMSVTSP